MEISSSNRPFPEEPTYKQDFDRSVELFEKSFKNLDHSTIEPQKKMYLKVMQESLSIMQESASAMLNQHLSGMKSQLEKDLTAYLEHPDATHKEAILQDIQKIKSS